MSIGFFTIAYIYWWTTMPIMANIPIENIHELFVLTPANIYRIIGVVGGAILSFQGKNFLEKVLISDLNTEKESTENSSRSMAIETNVKNICKHLGINAEETNSEIGDLLKKKQ
jgi:hypothetical protein